MSGRAKTPPLKAAIGVGMLRGSRASTCPGGAGHCHREKDPRRLQLFHSRDGPVGQHLVLSDQRAVDVGEEQSNGAGWQISSVMLFGTR